MIKNRCIYHFLIVRSMSILSNSRYSECVLLLGSETPAQVPHRAPPPPAPGSLFTVRAAIHVRVDLVIAKCNIDVSLASSDCSKC